MIAVVLMFRTIPHLLSSPPDGEELPLPTQELEQVNSDLTQLSILLEEKKWRMADLKTGELILVAANRYREGWLDSASLRAFPCESLIAIDKLWETHTDGHFSFRRQIEIWNQLAANPQEFDDESYEKFGQALGWYIPEDDRWLSVDQLQFSLTSPRGHLPSGGKGGMWSFGIDGIDLLKRCYP